MVRSLLVFGVMLLTGFATALVAADPSTDYDLADYHETMSPAGAAPIPWPKPKSSGTVQTHQRLLSYVTCKDECTGVSRAHLVPAITKFCTHFENRYLTKQDWFEDRTITYSGKLAKGEQGAVSITVQRDPSFMCKDYPIIAASVAWCNRGLREILDGCDTTSTEHKQGGFYWSECVQWYFDPNPYKPCKK